MEEEYCLNNERSVSRDQTNNAGSILLLATVF